MKSFSVGKLLVAAALVAVSANAVDWKMTGTVEGGAAAIFGHTTVANNDSAFYLDHAMLNTTVTLNDKTKVVVTKGFSISGQGGGLGTFGTTLAGRSTANYFNKLGLLTAANGSIAFAINEAYLMHECATGVGIMGGVFKTPFGMEGLWNRYDYLTYWMSNGYNSAVTMGWNYDVGLGVTLSEFIPGKLEVAVVDGRVNAARGQGTGAAGVDNSNPAFAARYHLKLDVGNMEITPVASVYMSRFQGGGGPNDMGLSGGLMWKMGMLSINAEFIDTQSAPAAGGTKVSSRSIWFEPGVDLGMFQINGKVDLARVGGVNDTNFGLALGKKWDAWRLRAAWQYISTGGGAVKFHDLRVLLGTSF